MEQIVAGISTGLLWTVGAAGLVAASSFVCGGFAVALKKLKSLTGLAV